MLCSPTLPLSLEIPKSCTTYEPARNPAVRRCRRENYPQGRAARPHALALPPTATTALTPRHPVERPRQCGKSGQQTQSSLSTRL